MPDEIPPGTTRAAVVVGVNKTGTLPPLQAAASGAHDIQKWLADHEGYHVTPVTDAAGSAVTLMDVITAVRRYVDLGTLETLVVYFAGHGYLNGQSEIWLLSGAPDNPIEAINLQESAEFARNSNIANVVFIADTCRSTPQSLRANNITGGSIFPNRDPGNVDPEVDRFFATRPGDAAVEISVNEARTEYRGLFSEVLREMFTDPAASDIQIIKRNGKDIPVIMSRTLRDRLPDVFVNRAKAISAAIRQKPMLRLECDPDVYIAEAQNMPPPQPPDVVTRGGIPITKAGPAAMPKPPVQSFAEAAQDLVMSTRLPTGPTVVVRGGDDVSPSGELTSQLIIEAARQKQEHHSAHFETRCGVTISGTSITEAVGFQGVWVTTEDVGQENNRVRIHSAENDWGPNINFGSVALKFSTGTGTIIAAIPGYVASLIVRDGNVISVSYLPAEGSRNWGEYLAFKDQIDEHRAIVATAARHGVLAVNRDDAKAFAKTIRRFKVGDPTLGLYAALAYAQVGLHRDIASVQFYMRRDIHADFFDVWMLAGGGEKPMPVVPVCPMLNQSWDYLRPRNVATPNILGTAERRQALWTTFADHAMPAIMDAAREGLLDQSGISTDHEAEAIAASIRAAESGAFDQGALLDKDDKSNQRNMSEGSQE
jgi:Caspase domain